MNSIIIKIRRRWNNWKRKLKWNWRRRKVRLQHMGVHSIYCMLNNLVWYFTICLHRFSRSYANSKFNDYLHSKTSRGGSYNNYCYLYITDYIHLTYRSNAHNCFVCLFQSISFILERLFSIRLSDFYRCHAGSPLCHFA